MNRLVAHRGDMTTYPENSLLALSKAADQGLLYIELDVQLSKDLEPIVIHDDNINRTTELDQNVRDLTADELKSIPLIYSSNSDLKESMLNIPTLKQAVDVLNN